MEVGGEGGPKITKKIPLCETNFIRKLTKFSYGLVWYGLVLLCTKFVGGFSGMVWFSMVWYGLVSHNFFFRGGPVVWIGLDRQTQTDRQMSVCLTIRLSVCLLKNSFAQF